MSVQPTAVPRRRSMLLGGLRLATWQPGAMFWTYAVNLGLALAFSVRLHTQLSAVLDHSLAAERLHSAFDLGVALAAVERTSRDVPSGGSAAWLGVPLYLAVYFLLVPGCLFCFATGATMRLGLLLATGARFFWRFVRITLLTLLVSLLVLAPLTLLAAAVNAQVDDRLVGWTSLLLRTASWLVLLLVAALLRLYFDLVECYTVLLDEQYRPSGAPDRRVRRTLLPALRTLRDNLLRALGSFGTLLALGLAAFALLTRTALHTLAQPRVWPLFLLTQVGLLVLLFSRFAQRGAEMTLALDNPLPSERLQVEMNPPPPPPFPTAATPPDPPHEPNPHDALPDPEPASPSLPEPDPGVFHPDAPDPA